MKRRSRKSIFKYFIWNSIILGTLLLSACMPNVSNELRTRSSNNQTGAQNVSVGQGYILADNPIILGNNANISPSYNLNKFLSVAPITTNSYLISKNDCYFPTSLTSKECFSVVANKDSLTPLQTSTGKWDYRAESPEFLQVNTFYHMQKILDKFFVDIRNGYNTYLLNPAIFDLSTPNAVVRNDSKYEMYLKEPLSIEADCQEEDNAYYNSAQNKLCFGFFADSAQMRWAQDSTVIYHEAGHFFQHMQFNFRNLSNPFNPARPRLGNFGYSEASSIGEGLSDYFSYYVNSRTHFAEWAAGRILGQSRPLKEDDPVHISALNTSSNGRLSYPDFLTYSPNFPEQPVEDEHYAGMIMSHYLVALTEDLMSKCGYTKDTSKSFVMFLVQETLAELGDLSTKGSNNGAIGSINLSSTYALDWVMKNNPVTYRSFMQTLAKKLKGTVGNPSINSCRGTVYTKDQIEKLIDDYGLLLFRTYNEKRNHANPVTNQNTLVTTTNRNKTTLISKNFLKFDPTVGAAYAYIIDNQANIYSLVRDLVKEAIINIDSQFANVPYNNGNGKLSPGEIVGVVLNLYNDSNSTMGGVQVLANDYYNLDPATKKPCSYQSTSSTSDKFPTSSEGGTTCAAASASALTDFTPGCFIQTTESGATKWVSQNTFRNKLALDSSMCIDSTKPEECFIKAIKGADQAWFSKIDPKKNWMKTLTSSTNNTTPEIKASNLILYEVSKHLPHGTVINCRFRARFTNCDDCYHDSTRSQYDFFDTDYNGDKPFKILNLQMTVLD